MKEDWKNTFEPDECKKRKNQNIIYVKSYPLFNTYRNYLTEENLGFVVPTYKIVKTVLSDIGITKQQKKINGQNNDYYVIDTDDLEQQLESYDLEVTVEELGDDDFE